MKYLLAIVLFCSYILPRQDAKVQVHKLRSGVKCVVTFEEKPFEKIGIQLAVHGEKGNLDSALLKAFQEAGQTTEYQRTESCALFQFYTKARPGSAETALRSLVPIINRFAKEHPDYFAEVYIYVMGGFKQHDIPAALRNL